MSNWLESDLSDLADFVGHDAVELAEKAADALLPQLAQDLTPIVQKAITQALGTFPFGSDLAPVASDAAAQVVADLVAAIEAKLNAAEEDDTVEDREEPVPPHVAAATTHGGDVVTSSHRVVSPEPVEPVVHDEDEPPAHLAF